MIVRIRVITVLILCLHFIVVSTSPAPSWSVHRPRKHAKWMWARQARQKPPSQTQGTSSRPANRSQEMKTNHHVPYHLPPVSEVFKMVADAESRQKPTQDYVSPTMAPQVLVPSSSTFPTVSKVDAALAPITTIVQPSSPVSYRGPGLAIPSQTVTPKARVPEQFAIITGLSAPTGSTSSSENFWTYSSAGVSNAEASGTVSSTRPMETGTLLDASQSTSTDATPHGTASRLIMICAVMASLIALMFLVYFILNYPLLAFCRRKKDGEADSWTKIASPPPPGTYQGAEKEIIYQTPRSQYSASSVYSSHSGEGSASMSNTRLNSTVPDEVIDISLNYPRSKFSFCSSEYPASVRSQSSTRSVLAPLYQEQIDSSTLSPAYEFYHQSYEPSEGSRHSRTHSEPIVRPDVTGGAPRLLIRAIQHRRSRSISGLTYTVKQEQRESGSSAGNWTGSPQSPSGWPSAL